MKPRYLILPSLFGIAAAGLALAGDATAFQSLGAGLGAAGGYKAAEYLGGRRLNRLQEQFGEKANQTLSFLFPTLPAIALAATIAGGVAGQVAVDALDGSGPVTVEAPALR